MNKMFWRIGLYLVCLIFSINSAYAYEFKRINELFHLLETKYIHVVDAQDLFANSCDIINQFDRSINVYNNGSKAFLYKNNTLITSFDLPQKDDIHSWLSSMTTILEESANHSNIIFSYATKLEDVVFNSTLRKLDKYSRIEDNIFSVAEMDYRIQDNILYIKCNHFAKGTSNSLKKIISLYPQIKGLILDLRQNRGGDFNEAIMTADLFLDNVLIAYSSEKNQPNRFYNASSGDILQSKPIAVLTSDTTASAAEIVAAALHEQSRATLIGTKTYGKGSIQQVQKLTNQKLYITSGYFFSPSGKAINDIGIMPDICTEDIEHRHNSLIQNDIAIAFDFIKQRLS